MTKDQALFLVEALQEEDIEAEHREGYNGRGMYSKTTHGVVTKNVGDLLGAALRKIIMIFEDDGGFPEDKDNIPSFEDFEPKTDSMGLSVIIY